MRRDTGARRMRRSKSRCGLPGRTGLPVFRQGQSLSQARDGLACHRCEPNRPR